MLAGTARMRARQAFRFRSIKHRNAKWFSPDGSSLMRRITASAAMVLVSSGNAAWALPPAGTVDELTESAALDNGAVVQTGPASRLPLRLSDGTAIDAATRLP